MPDCNRLVCALDAQASRLSSRRPWLPADMTQSRFVVGLISDTHGQFRPEIPRVFAGVDLIVHAGDVGGSGVLAALAAIAPVEAVSGNVDDRNDPMLPRE